MEKIRRRKWPTELVLKTARERTKELACDNAKRVQTMLSSLLQEAGWTDQQFLDAMIKDCSRRGGQARWTVSLEA